MLIGYMWVSKADGSQGNALSARRARWDARKDGLKVKEERYRSGKKN